MTVNEKTRILYLCTGNSCRSPMAEFFTNQLKGEEFFAASAGVKPHGVDPRAVKAMAEAGVDITPGRSKDVSEMLGQEWDRVVTLCGNAQENCPFFPGPVKRVHKGFDDPPYLAKDAANEKEAMSHYRRVRDEIKAMVRGLPQSLEME